jgi:hypothetical protein
MNTNTKTTEDHDDSVSNKPERKIEPEHFPTVDRLHSDVLEDKYGPIHSIVIRHDDIIREAHLMDASDISRTYALTFFSFDRTNEEMCAINEKIKSGGLIGQTFREHGYEIRKNVIDVFTVPLPDWLKKDFHSSDAFAKARLSEFYAKKDGSSPIIYGTVLEVYAPDFRGPIINDVDLAQINPSTEMFEQLGVSKDMIWGRLDKATQKDEWADLQDKYERAKQSSLPLVFKFRSAIQQYIGAKETTNPHNPTGNPSETP